MKSKLVTMIWIGALAITASVPSAMAIGRSSLSNARGPASTTKSARKSAATMKKSPSKTALPQPHTILPGATNNY
jgi:hypothetical protein